MLWARLLAYVTGTVNQELLLRNEYLAAENGILRGQTRVDCCFQKERKRHWPRSLTAWVERLCRTWRQRPSPIRFWVGIGSSSRTHLMGRDSVEAQGAPR